MTAANIITITRMILVPFFVAFFVTKHMTLAMATFCVAGFSDLIDGTVARVFNQRSDIGPVLDPIADKLLLDSSFICLVFQGIIPVWFFVLAISRDIMIVSGIIFLTLRHIDYPRRALYTSKIATFAQMMTIVSGLIIAWKQNMLLYGVEIQSILNVCMWTSAVFIAISGILYVRLGFSLLGGRKQVAAS